MVTSELKDPRKVIDPVLLSTFLLDDLRRGARDAVHRLPPPICPIRIPLKAGPRRCKTGVRGPRLERASFVAHLDTRDAGVAPPFTLRPGSDALNVTVTEPGVSQFASATGLAGPPFSEQGSSSPPGLHLVGNADQVIAGRKSVLREAWAAHPERFVRGVPAQTAPGGRGPVWSTGVVSEPVSPWLSVKSISVAGPSTIPMLGVTLTQYVTPIV